MSNNIISRYYKPKLNTVNEIFPIIYVIALIILWLVIILYFKKLDVLVAYGFLLFYITFFVFYRLHYIQREDEREKRKNSLFFAHDKEKVEEIVNNEYGKSQRNEKFQDIFSLTHIFILVGVFCVNIFYWFYKKSIFPIEVEKMSYEVAKSYLQIIITSLSILYSGLIIGFSLHVKTGDSLHVYKKELLLFGTYLLWQTLVILFWIILPLIKQFFKSAPNI